MPPWETIKADENETQLSYQYTIKSQGTEFP